MSAPNSEDMLNDNLSYAVAHAATDEEMGLKTHSSVPALDTINSPLILPIAILMYSAFQLNTAGIYYMVFLIIFIFLRSKLFTPTNNEKCNYMMPLLGKTSNINIFISIFSLSYVMIPMIILKSYNIASIIILICYTFTNIGISMLNKCYVDSSIIGDILFSVVSGVVSILIIIAINSSLNTPNKNLLFIDTANSSGEICSVPSNQNFKCNVYQNGQLISQLPNVPN